MHYFDERIVRASKDFKTDAMASIYEHKVTQADIADALGIEQCTVSRQLSVGSDLHMPAFVIPFLCTPKLLPFREDLLRWQVEKACYSLGRRVKVHELNGTVADEAMELAEHLGKIAAQVNSGHMDARRGRRLIDQMRQTLDRAAAELDAQASEGGK
jgi:hypothetical protein